MKNCRLESMLESAIKVDDDATSQNPSILDLLIDEEPKTVSLTGVLVGELAGFDDVGQPLVNFHADVPYELVLARSTIALRHDNLGANIVLAFEHGDPRKPIITGFIWQTDHLSEQGNAEAKLDGERIVLRAKKEIVLRCGKASITLTRAGKVLIRGKYVLNRSSGVNRLKGGSVQIN